MRAPEHGTARPNVCPIFRRSLNGAGTSAEGHPMRRVIAVLLPMLIVLAAAPVAGADLLPPKATDCAAESLAPVFRPWHDGSSYTLSPGGSFEKAAGWTGGRVV